jgi:lipopolysaccharide assembly protein A
MSTLFIAFVLAILIALFALQNTLAVNVRFLLWEYDTSLVLIILGSTMFGAILTFLASLGSRIRRVRTTRQLEETVRSQGERIRELEGRVCESQASSTSTTMRS